MKAKRSLNFCTFRHAVGYLGGVTGSPAKASSRARRAPKQEDFVKGMVLPDRIELSTSPLPMECSTTELRQRARKTRHANHSRKRAVPCHKGGGGATVERTGLSGASPP